MSFQFVVQRDLDGTWSVRERATNARPLDDRQPYTTTAKHRDSLSRLQSRAP